jgi:hypothetical protein
MIARSDAGNSTANLFNYSGPFMLEYRRQGCPIFLISNVSIGLTNAGCNDTNQYLVYARRFKVERHNLKRAPFLRTTAALISRTVAPMFVISNSP